MIAPIVAEVPPGAVLVDVRWPAGSAAYAAGHAAGAVFLDVDTSLAGEPAPGGAGGRHPLPTPEAFAAVLGAAGIGDHDVVVAYDGAGGVIAARLVWMLRVTGHPAALLEQAPPLTATTVPMREPAEFTPRAWPTDRLVSLEQLEELLSPGRVAETLLLDARPTDRFDGAPDPLDPRPGHIPGAVSLPCRENIGQSPHILRRRLAAVGVGPQTSVVSSCGSGVTACHTLLVLEQLGYAPGRLYVGSYSEWAASGRPVATS